MILAYQRNPKLLSKIMSSGANVNAQDKQSQTALMIAANGNSEIASVLLKAGAHADLKDHKGQIALSLAKSREVFISSIGMSGNSEEIFRREVSAIIRGRGEIVQMIKINPDRGKVAAHFPYLLSIAVRRYVLQ